MVAMAVGVGGWLYGLVMEITIGSSKLAWALSFVSNVSE